MAEAILKGGIMTAGANNRLQNSQVEADLTQLLLILQQVVIESELLWSLTPLVHV